MYLAGYRCERPVIFHKNAPPSRVRGEQQDYFSNDWEYCVGFRPKDSTMYFNWPAIATEKKYKTGGHFRQRGKDGQRRKGSNYPTANLARPRDVLRVIVGGGQMGSPLAHLNEAPYPEKIVEPFVLTCAPVGGVVLDPFCGSGTTPKVAKMHGRHFIAIDNRESQVKLTKRRLKEVA